LTDGLKLKGMSMSAILM